MRFCSYLLVFLLPIESLYGQETVTVMTWNLLNIYTSSIERVPYYRTVTDSMLPDILAVQEVHGLDAARMFRNEVLQDILAIATFIDGYDSDRALCYDILKFAVAGAQAIGTNLRDINKVALVHLPSGDTVHTYTVHLKVVASSTNHLERNQEVMSLQQSTNALPEGSLFLLLGDMNMHQSSEPGYARLLHVKASYVNTVTPSKSGPWSMEVTVVIS
jgi:endonuclease/exonuclease/phosphatase family metal-dependent hydrolase